MHWSISPFAAAHAALFNESADPAQVIGEIREDLTNLLANPPKNVASRDSLGKRPFVVNGQEINVNEKFLTAVVRVSDELNLDERVCAEFLCDVSRDARRIGFDLVESAVALFYTRRAYIIDILRYLVQCDMRLVSNDTAISALFSVEQQMLDLKERAKTNEFMGLSAKNPLWEVEKSFLCSEHERLSRLLYVLLDKEDAESCSKLLKHVSQFSTYDSLMIDYIPVLCQVLSTAPQFVECKFKLEPWEGALQFVFYSFQDEDKPIPYATVCQNIRAAIDKGGIEFLMALGQDVFAQSSASTSPVQSLLRIRVPQFQCWSFLPSNGITDILHNSMQAVCVAFISNCADILKEMRLCEEDMHLSQSDMEKAYPGVDLERFFQLLSNVYAKIRFFEDRDDAMYGFLVWGSDIRVRTMKAAYCELLAALSNSEIMGNSLHRLLLRKEFSWTMIYEHLEQYVRNVENNQVDRDAAILAGSYLNLMHAVTSLSAEALVYVRNQMLDAQKETVNILPLLFKLLKTGPRPQTLEALVPFVCAEVWNFLNLDWDEQDLPAFVDLVLKLVESDLYAKNMESYIDFILPLKIDKVLDFVLVLLKGPYAQHTFRALFSSKVYKTLFAYICVNFDDLETCAADHPMCTNVVKAVQIVSILLERSSYPSYSFDKPVLYHLEVVPYLALFLSSKHTSVALSSIKLLGLLQNSPEFKPVIERQSRVLSILTSTSESARIRVQMMAYLRRDAHREVKVALLTMLLNELQELKSTRYPITVAHFLLGFRQSQLGLELKIELDPTIGGISSSNSVFGSVCELLVKSVHNDPELLRLSSAILGSLVEDPLTQDLILNYLRPLNFVLHLLQQAPSSANDDVFAYKSVLLTVTKLELRACQTQVLLSLEKAYLDVLLPTIFNFIDFEGLYTSGIKPGSKAALECLNAWCELVPVLDVDLVFVTRAMKLLITFVPQYAQQSTTFATPLARLLVQLVDKYAELCSDGDVVYSFIVRVYAAASASLQPAQMSTELREYLYLLLWKSIQVCDIDKQQNPNVRRDVVNSLLHATVGRTIAIAGDDSLNRTDALQLNSIVYLDMLLSVERGNVQTYHVLQSLIKLNFIAVFVNQCVFTENSNVEQVALSLLLQIAQNGIGAEELAASEFIGTTSMKLGQLQRESLVLVLQTLTAIVVNAGPENKHTQRSVRDVLDRNKPVVDKTLSSDNGAKRTVTVLLELTR